jgi:NADPH:quinone reductase-like Zn-dependent oxidoreductase
VSTGSTMRAAVVREHGGLDNVVVEDRPVPEAGPGEVRVAVRAAGLNHLDLWVRRGVPGHTFPLPLVLGSDFSGVVDQVGPGVGTAQVGDEVCVAPGHSCGACQACASGRDNLCKGYGIFGETRDGGCAEYAVVPAVNLLPKPPEMSFEQAAAWPLAFLTAWHMLVARAQLRPGETVLVHAAGSGVGSAAVQVAKLWRARVVATASTDEKLRRAAELGADELVNYTTTDFAREVRRLTDKRGVDVVVEHTGQATWDGSVRSLCWGGRLVTCGATSGWDARVDLRVLFFKRISLLGSTMGSRGELFEVLGHLCAGRLRAVVDRVLPLEEVREAHRVLEEREQFGKVVLSCGRPG